MKKWLKCKKSRSIGLSNKYIFKYLYHNICVARYIKNSLFNSNLTFIFYQKGVILNREILREWFGGEALLANLSSIYIGYKSLISIDPATFEGLNKLENLYLNGNNLTTLVASVFWDLTNLRVLELWNSKLKYLPPSLFKNLNKLEQLYLDVNELSSLNENLFKNSLAELQILDLSSNKLSQLNGSIFGDLKKLVYLGLRFNELSTLNESLFHNLNSLQILNLSGNKLTSLPNSVFKDLFQLRDLRLDDNQLTNLNESTFSNIKNLNNLTIYLKKNPITSAQDDYVKNLCRNISKCIIDISN